MVKLLFSITFIIITSAGFTQEEKLLLKEPTGGEFDLGVRSTFSAFSTDGYTGLGSGGQFRLRLAPRLTTEWFADYISTNLNNLGKRIDYHIGWAVAFYPLNTLTKKWSPYITAGHCFDYTKISENSTIEKDNSDNWDERWSSAVSIGIGTNWRLNDKFDFSLTTLYMGHLGNDLHADEHNGELIIGEEHAGSTSFEGHLLINLSANIRIADFW